MAAIVPVATGTGVVAHKYGYRRTATAQATTGQTDWLDTPADARFLTIFLSITAVGGNTPIVTPSVLAASPSTRDDGEVILVGEAAGLTGITAASQLVIDIGPGITGIANDVTNAAAADSYVSINAVLPELIGIRLTNDRTTGDEVYTYNLSARFRP